MDDRERSPIVVHAATNGGTTIAHNAALTALNRIVTQGNIGKGEGTAVIVDAAAVDNLGLNRLDANDSAIGDRQTIQIHGIARRNGQYPVGSVAAEDSGAGSSSTQIQGAINGEGIPCVRASPKLMVRLPATDPISLMAF